MSAFKEAFVANFLGTWCAMRYEKARRDGRMKELEAGPVDEAIRLAEIYESRESILGVSATASPWATGKDESRIDQDAETQHLLNWIQKRGGSTTTREVHKNLKSRYPTSEHAELAIRKLHAANLGYWEKAPVSESGGRPSSRFFLWESPNPPVSTPSIAKDHTAACMKPGNGVFTEVINCVEKFISSCSFAGITESRFDELSRIGLGSTKLKNVEINTIYAAIGHLRKTGSVVVRRTVHWMYRDKRPTFYAVDFAPPPDVDELPERLRALTTWLRGSSSAVSTGDVIKMFPNAYKDVVEVERHFKELDELGCGRWFQLRSDEPTMFRPYLDAEDVPDPEDSKERGSLELTRN